MQQRNLLFFILLAFVLLLAAIQLRQRLMPQPEKKPQPPVDVAKPREPKKKDDAVLTKLPAQPPVTEEKDLISLGALAEESTYHLHVRLDPRGAGVREVVLNKFQQASEGGLPEDKQLSLVPADANKHEPAFAMYHFDPEDANFLHPLDTLGQRKWQVVKADGKEVSIDHVDGRERQSVSFRTEVSGVGITKTYSLVEGEYHVGLRVDLERRDAKTTAKTTDKTADKREVKFRYQLTGAKGLPVEGKWYTTTFRNALIGTEDDRGYIYRDLQELRQISSWAAGEASEAKDGQWLRYAGVSVQYFASVIVVDDRQSDQKFLRRAQATLERAVSRGKIKGGDLVRFSHIVIKSDDGKTEDTIFIPPDLRPTLGNLREGTRVSAVYRLLTRDQKAQQTFKEAIVVAAGDEAGAIHPLWEDDITMRVTTDAVDIKPGATVSHHYLLYNGPVKPSLLGKLTGDKAVGAEIVDRYADKLQLNTMTDHQSPGMMGSFAHTIGWTWLLIQSTNLMHRILGWLHWAVPSYGLCIIILTVMVRGLMYPLSRKQAMMSMKMQALAPELKKLQQKYKDDKQTLGMAQMDLYRKHGVNPFGSCWVLLLQMPVFMGLYYALQESIQFRLASFWPSWIHNLAAPDMMIWWGQSIPWISRPEDYGSSIVYLGPYLNLLPIIAVSFMIVQQKMMMPPPTDEQQEMQQKMMKWMMVVFGFMFYKVAAGLCIYFIATTLWGFAERKLMPKAKIDGVGDDKNKTAADTPVNGDQVSIAQKTDGSQPNGSLSKKAIRNKRKNERARQSGIKEAEPATSLGRMVKRLGDWWDDLLEQAKKK